MTHTIKMSDFTIGQLERLQSAVEDLGEGSLPLKRIETLLTAGQVEMSVSETPAAFTAYVEFTAEAARKAREQRAETESGRGRF